MYILKRKYKQNIEFWITLIVAIQMITIGLYKLTFLFSIFPLLLCIVAWLVADIITAFFHWMCDNYFDITNTIIYSFRFHHKDPKEICSWSVVGNCQKTAAIQIYPLLIIGLIFSLILPWSYMLPYGLVNLGILLSNQIHAWSHDLRQDIPYIVRLLQKFRILLSKRGHSKHHQKKHLYSYGVVCGWSNFILDNSRIFRLLEWLILKILKVAPAEGALKGK